MTDRRPGRHPNEGTVQRVAELEAQLAAARARLRSMFAENPHPMWIYDIDTLRFLDVNAAAVHRYGYSHDEFLAMDITQIRPSDEVDRLRDDLRGERPALQASSLAWHHRVKDGRIIDVDVTSHVIDFEGRSAVMVLAQDITARRRLDEAERDRDIAEMSNKAKSEYLSRMSHELRTPLTAIIGFSELLEMTGPREDQKLEIAAIIKASVHLLSLINEVLDIARIESGHESLSMEAVDVSEVVRECVNLTEPMARDHRISLQVKAAASRHRFVQADRQRLAQVLLNLLSNAVKYNRDGGSVTMNCEITGGDRVRLSVADTGRGIPAERIDSAFQPFERLGAESSGIGGTGLGLALSKRLVEAMGGRVGLSSNEDEGTTFWVELTGMHRPRARRGTAPPAEDGPAAPDLPPCTVLYVEDNLATVRLVEGVVALRPNVRLVAAMQGGLALDLAVRNSPDVILLDLHLPDMDGATVLHALREHESTREIPIVILSADASRRQSEELLRAGASAYLTKPLRVRDLLNVLDAVAASQAVAGSGG